MVYFKRILLFLLLFILIFNKVSAFDGVDYTYSDNNENILNDYDSLTRDFLSRLSNALQSNNSTNRETAQNIINLLNNSYFLYVWRGDITDYTDIPGDKMVSNRLFRPRYISFILYRNVSSTSPHNNMSYQGYDGTLWNCQFYDMGSTYSRYGKFDFNTPSLDNDSGTTANMVCIPRMLISYTSADLQDFKYRYNDSLNNQQIVELLQDILNETESINDFLQDDSFDRNNIDLNGVDSYNFDYYDDGIDNAFQVLKDAFTNNNTSRYIFFNIPFTNQQIVLDTNWYKDKLNNGNFAYISNLLYAFWWYFFCKLIIYDILKIVQSISSGDFLTNKTDSLITIDML